MRGVAPRSSGVWGGISVYILNFERIYAIMKSGEQNGGGHMYNIDFYRTSKGECDIEELKDDTFVLLHHFRKKTQKTPRREIEKAKAERDDWVARNK